MKKRPKTRFYKCSFKLTAKQKAKIRRLSRLQKITPTKLIKRAISDYLNKHADMLPEQEYVISKNQLKLFKEADQPEDFPTSLF